MGSWDVRLAQLGQLFACAVENGSRSRIRRRIDSFAELGDECAERAAVGTLRGRARAEVREREHLEPRRFLCSRLVEGAPDGGVGCRGLASRARDGALDQQ